MPEEVDSKCEISFTSFSLIRLFDFGHVVSDNGSGKKKYDLSDPLADASFGQMDDAEHLLLLIHKELVCVSFRLRKTLFQS